MPVENQIILSNIRTYARTRAHICFMIQYKCDIRCIIIIVIRVDSHDVANIYVYIYVLDAIDSIDTHGKGGRTVPRDSN
jgi:hypothetical protein